MLTPRRRDLAICELRRRRRDRRRRSHPARAAALSLRAARRVPRPGDLCRRDQRHHREADARQSAAADRAPPHHLVLRAADGVDFAAALAAVRHDRPFEPAEGLLRRLDHAGRGVARNGAAHAEGAAVEPLRPDRDRAARHHARPRRSVAQARLLRPRRAQCRDPRRRRSHARRCSPARSARSCIARRI